MLQLPLWKWEEKARLTDVPCSRRSRAPLRLLPPSSQLPAAPEHQRRLPGPWKLQPGPHAHPGRVPQGRPHEGQHGTPRGPHEQRRTGASGQHEPRRRRRRPDEPWRTQGPPRPRESQPPRPAWNLHRRTANLLHVCLRSTTREAATGATLATRTATSTTGTAATLAATGTAWTRPRLSTRAGSRG